MERARGEIEEDGERGFYQPIRSGVGLAQLIPDV